MISATPSHPQFRDAPQPAVPRAETPLAARLRRGTVRAYAAAVAAMPVAAFWAPAAGDDWVVLVFMLCGGAIAFAGLTLLIFAVVRRTARDAAVVLAALLALAGSAWLLPAAGTAGKGAALDRRAARLEALVAELRAAPPAVTSVLRREATRRPPDENYLRGLRLLERARALGYSWVQVKPAYVLFLGPAPFSPDALYVTGSGVPQAIGNCGRPELRFAGGRWYLYRCLADEYD